jgi:hypothetical protein
VTRRGRTRALALVALALAPGTRAAAAPKAPFGQRADGTLLPGCSYVADAPALTARIEFVGGIQFAEGEGPSRPSDPAAEVASLQVGELHVDGDPRAFAFLGAAQEPDGFVLLWRTEGPPAERVAVYTRWASLKDPPLRKKNVVCREPVTD